MSEKQGPYLADPPSGLIHVKDIIGMNMKITRKCFSHTSHSAKNEDPTREVLYNKTDDVNIFFFYHECS